MALNWYWKDKCGELIVSQKYEGEKAEEFIIDLYQGNAVLIMIYRYKKNDEDWYNMWGFFADKGHMKRCLGLEKDADGVKENIYNEDRCRFLKIRLNKAKNRYWKDIVTALATAFDDLTIELYSEKENDNEA